MIVLKGWNCPGCKVFNGEEKDRRETCRSCDGPRVEPPLPGVVGKLLSTELRTRKSLASVIRSWDEALSRADDMESKGETGFARRVRLYVQSSMKDVMLILQGD